MQLPNVHLNPNLKQLCEITLKSIDAIKEPLKKFIGNKCLFNNWNSREWKDEVYYMLSDIRWYKNLQEWKLGVDGIWRRPIIFNWSKIDDP